MGLNEFRFCLFCFGLLFAIGFTILLSLSYRNYYRGSFVFNRPVDDFRSIAAIAVGSFFVNLTSVQYFQLVSDGNVVIVASILAIVTSLMLIGIALWLGYRSAIKLSIPMNAQSEQTQDL